MSVLGAFQRGSTKCCLHPTAVRLLAPGTRPPCESTQDVVGSGILKSLQKNTVLFADGAKAWKAATKYEPQQKLKVRNVVHSKQEFTRRSKQAARKNGSKISGTQLADKSWHQCDNWIPSSLNVFLKGRTVHPHLFEYMYSWIWRYSQEDVFSALGDACR